MDILWDEAKSTNLKKTRGISFAEVAHLILDKKYLAVLENPVRPHQMIFVTLDRVRLRQQIFLIQLTKGKIHVRHFQILCHHVDFHLDGRVFYCPYPEHAG